MNANNFFMQNKIVAHIKNSLKAKSQQLSIVCNIILVVLLIVSVNFAYNKRIALKNTQKELAEIHRVSRQTRQDLENERKNADELLAWLVTSEKPDYQSLSDFEKIRHIRNWLLQRLPVAHSDFSDLPALQVLVKNLRHERGVWCGGSNYLLAVLCNKLGFEAVSIDFGVRNTSSTHVMTAVRIQYDGRSLLIFSDAYIGIEFFAENGDPADIKELTRALRDGHENAFYTTYLLPGQKLKLDEKIMMDLGAFQKRWLGSTEKLIAQHGYKESMFSYLLLPIDIKAENPELYKELMAFYQQELGISLPR
jgi:hypothetical protein